MKRSRADVWLAVCVIVGASAYLIADSLLPSASIGGPLGPKGFPALIGAGLILSGLLLLREHHEKRHRPPAAIPASPELAAGPEPRARDTPVPILIAMVAWTALYYFCFEPVGYLIATVVFLLGLLSYFHRGHHRTNCIIAIVFTVVVDTLFSHFLNVPMPTGILPI
jgi:putative tricarboxylic transport membrane protein